MTLELAAARIPSVEDIGKVERWRALTDQAVSALPEPWRGLMREHGSSHATLRAAPAPLGPLVSTNRAGDETEAQVLDAVGKIRTIRWFMEGLDKAAYLAKAFELRAEADAAAASPPAPV